MDRLSAMIAFRRVVERGSLTAAARQLGVTPARISKQISKLEDFLGVKLLYRTTRRIALTEAGRAFSVECQRVIEAADEAERAVAKHQGRPRGLLRVNAPVVFGTRHLGPAIAEFQNRCLEVDVELTLNDRFIDLVEEGFDVALRIARLQSSALIARRLAESPSVLCASPDYLRRRGRPRRPVDLAEHDCLIYTLLAEQPALWVFDGPDGRESVRVNGRLKASNGEILVQAAEAGLGFVVTPVFMVDEALRSGRLIASLPRYRTPVSTIAAVYPANRHVSPKLRVFIDFLAEHFADPSWLKGLPMAAAA
ncbi:MAG: LysR family transcriptional regulator [Alphaproteobacteria bacterium]|nr:LysR family transcriptional regulator [Alphaproteobacteria bacterium]